MVSFHAQLNEALIRQKQRMEQAFPSEHEERRRNRRLRAEGAVEAPGMQGVKHALEAESSADAAKRAKMETVPIPHQAGSGIGRGVEVDISRFPLEGVIEAVMSSLNAISADHLTRTMEASGCLV
jgi:symplekin